MTDKTLDEILESCLIYPEDNLIEKDRCRTGLVQAFEKGKTTGREEADARWLSNHAECLESQCDMKEVRQAEARKIFAELDTCKVGIFLGKTEYADLKKKFGVDSK